MMAALAMAGGGWGVPARMERIEASEGTPDLAVARLARRAASGDRAAFARLVDLHKRLVFGLCLRLLQHPEEARDAAQETFTRAWGALATYDVRQPFPPGSSASPATTASISSAAASPRRGSRRSRAPREKAAGRRTCPTSPASPPTSSSNGPRPRPRSRWRWRRCPPATARRSTSSTWRG